MLIQNNESQPVGIRYTLEHCGVSRKELLWRILILRSSDWFKPNVTGKDAHDVYEKVLQSTNFAASQRKGGGNNDMKAIGTIIAAVEIKRDIAELCRQQLFPQDDIDKILRDFRHTEVAIQ